MNRKSRIFEFLGRQLGRVKMGQTYYSIILLTMNAISLITIAFHFDLWVLLIIFPLIILITYGIGFLFDKGDINLEDYRKQVEMQSRKLNIADLKFQEFQLVLVGLIIKASKGEVDEDQIMAKYKEYVKKWS